MTASVLVGGPGRLARRQGSFPQASVCATLPSAWVACRGGIMSRRGWKWSLVAVTAMLGSLPAQAEPPDMIDPRTIASPEAWIVPERYAVEGQPILEASRTSPNLHSAVL
jgi:hypothetical protein